MDERLIYIGELWEKAVLIKARCQNISVEDLEIVTELANAFNDYCNKRVIYQVTGCKIPNICGKVANLLKQAGLIKNTDAKTINRDNNPPIYKF